MRKTHTVITNSKGQKRMAGGQSWYAFKNEKEKYYTKGQILIDYLWMLDKTIKELTEANPNRKLEVLDPCTGRKALVKEYDNVNWTLLDIEPETDDTVKADFLEYYFGAKKFDLVVCNPPFKLKKEFANKCMQLADNVIFISPLNAIPFYEYSLKHAYNFDFDVYPIIGLWHYDKSKNNKTKLAAINNYEGIQKYCKQIGYDEYMALENKDNYIVFMESLWEVDHIEQFDCKKTAPSLIDRFIDDENIEICMDLPKINIVDKTDKSNWTYNASNIKVKKGEPRLLWTARLKEGITVDDFYEAMNRRHKELFIRSINVCKFRAVRRCPLTDEEAAEWFREFENN